MSGTGKPEQRVVASLQVSRTGSLVYTDGMIWKLGYDGRSRTRFAHMARGFGRPCPCRYLALETDKKP